MQAVIKMQARAERIITDFVFVFDNMRMIISGVGVRLEGVLRSI